MLRASLLGLCLFSSTRIVFRACRQPLGLRTVPAYKQITTSRVAEFSTSILLVDRRRRKRKQVQDVLKKAGIASRVAGFAVVDEQQRPLSREAASEAMRNFMLEEDVESLLAEEILVVEDPIPTSILDSPPFAAGRPWTKKRVKNICYSALGKIIRLIACDVEEELKSLNGTMNPIDGEQEEGFPVPSPALPVIVKRHLVVLAQTQDVEEAWHSYITLIDVITRFPSVYKYLPHIPYAHLHRLSRLIAGNQPKTHRQYLRLLAVITYLKHFGGNLTKYQYNALVDHAGKGWRKTREEDLMHAKRVAKDLEIGHLPNWAEETYEHNKQDYAKLDPDIYTYTTLLATAARALHTKELLNISSLMQLAGLPPNRITHLALLRYFTQKRNIGGVRSTLQKMRFQNLELGLDGLNACMWAYGRNGRVDIVWMVYRLLRHNVIPETYTGEGDVKEITSRLAEEYVFVESNIRPNEITFTMVMQMMAYLGDFQTLLDVFQDMLTFENKEQGAPLFDDSGELRPMTYRPTVAVYRNIFLGFSKHGDSAAPDGGSDVTGWTIDNLLALFERFLQLPPSSSVTYAQVDIIMKAFSVTSGDNLALMRDVWLAIEEKFGPIIFKPSSSNRLIRLKAKLFPEQVSDTTSTPS